MTGWLKRMGQWLAPRLDQLAYYFAFFGWKKLDQSFAISKQNQILLALRYQELARAGVALPELRDVEFRAFSQHGEDGILLYLFALVGATDRRVVEICCGDGVECNAANLVIHHDWRGLLVDGSAAKIAFGRSFYSRLLNTLQHPPALVDAWVDAEGVNDLVRGHGVEGEIDLLSLDMDGVDYWVCRALTVVRPRVMVVEFNAALGPDRSLTVPYRRDFRARGAHGGASLAAWTGLLRERGYRLIGAEHSGINAFFVRSEAAGARLAEVGARECFERTRAAEIFARSGEAASKYEWIEV